MGLRGVCNCMCACMLCLNSSHTHKHIHTCRIKYFIWITTQHSWKHNFSLLHILYAGCLYTSVIITLFKCNFILTTLGCCISSFLFFCTRVCANSLSFWLGPNIPFTYSSCIVPIFFLHSFAVFNFFLSVSVSLILTLDHKQRLHSKWVLMPMTTSTAMTKNTPRSLNYECQ